MQFFTYTMTSGAIQINRQDGVSFVSVQTDPTNGQATVLGNIPFKNLTPSAVDLVAGEGVNFSSPTPSSPLEGITITWVAGTVDIMIGF